MPRTNARPPAGLTTLSISSVVMPGFTTACAVSKISRASLQVWRSVFSSFSLRMAAAAKQIWNVSEQQRSHVKGELQVAKYASALLMWMASAATRSLSWK